MMTLTGTRAIGPRFGSVDLLIDTYRRNNQPPTVKIGVIPDGVGYLRLNIPKRREDTLKDWYQYPLPVSVETEKLIAGISKKTQQGDTSPPPSIQQVAEVIQQVLDTLKPEKWTLWSIVGEWNSQEPLDSYRHQFEDQPDYPALPQGKKWIALPAMFTKPFYPETMQQQQQMQGLTQQQQQQKTFQQTAPEIDSRNFLEKTRDVLKDLNLRHSEPNSVAPLDWRGKVEFLYE